MIHIFITGASWKVIVIVGIRIWDVFIMSEEIFLLGLSSYLYLLIKSWVWTIHYHSLVLGLLSSRSRPKAQYMIWALNPTIAPRNFNFFLSSKEKSRVLIFLTLILFCPLTCTRRSAIYASHDCYWRFGAYEASLIAPGRVLFPLSNSEALIRWLVFLLGFWAR